MATRMHNAFLDIDHTDDEGSQGYDSEKDDFRKGARSPKRRKIESKEGDEAQELQNELSEEARKPEEDVESAQIKPKKIQEFVELPGISKPLTKKNLVATEAAVKRSGVVYLSRIPPFMKPTKLRSLLELHGTINRIFLTPEDPASHTRRVRNGGNKKRSYTDGWVEFVHKKDAKHACELLNAKIIGGKKGSYYHDDVWNLRYLRGFKWDHLTAQISEENAERAARLKAEISKTTKENKEFVQNVERAKMLEGMEVKKAAKRRKEDDDVGKTNQATSKEQKPKKGGERQRYFTQTTVASKQRSEDQPDQVKRVLSKIF